MRLFFIAVLLLFQNHSQPTHAQGVADQANNSPANYAHESLGSQSVGHRNEESQTHQDEDKRHYDPREDRLYRRYLCATIVGVLGGFIGIGILIWQAILTRKSADAALDAAIAAKTSSQAIINSERPWLFIQIITNNEPKIDENGIPEHLGFWVNFQNYGKTPAEVVGFDDHRDCRQDTDDLPLPPKYRLEGHVMVHTRMIPPTEKWRPPGESYFYVESFLPADDWKEIRCSRKRLIYWGRLQYRDLIEESKTIHELKNLGTIHETCFCYFWSPALNEFLICGPVGYNKHT